MFLDITTHIAITCCNFQCRNSLTVVGGAFITPATCESLIREKMAKSGWTEQDVSDPGSPPILAPLCRECTMRYFPAEGAKAKGGKKSRPGTRGFSASSPAANVP